MKKTLTLIIIVIVAVMAFLSDYKPFEEEKNKSTETGVLNTGELLEVSFFDVGQGDSTFLKLPGGETLLIDAGNPEDGGLVAETIKKKGYNKINYLIATHPHSDHIGGMAEVVKRLEVGKVYMPKVSHNTSSFEKLVSAVSDKNLKITEAKAGEVILDSGGIKISILSPLKNFYDDLNNYSAVIRVDYKNNSFLFMGDAEKQVEYEIIESGAELKADVLKVGHHGSSTSSSESFIELVDPEYAVISCGEGNDYGHPHREVMSLLNKNKINVLRTDEMGTVEIVSDGNIIQVKESE